MKLKARLIAGNLLATMMTLLLVGILVMNGIQQLSISSIEQQLIEQSELAEIYISQMHVFENDSSVDLSKETASGIISKLGLVLGNIRIYDENHSLLASSKDIGQDVLTENENKKILEAASKGNYAYIIKESRVYFASPVYVQDNTIAILEIVYPLAFFSDFTGKFVNILLIGAGLFAILVTFLIANIAERITKPINRLAAAAENYANRNFAPLETKGSDEIAQLYRSFNSMGAQLQEYIQRQKQFVSNVSHELRTPLTAIKGYSEYLMDEVRGHPDMEKAVYHLNNESRRLAKLVDEVLTLSRIDSGKENFQLGKLDLSAVVRETTEKMAFRAQKYGIKLASDIEPGILIWGDREKMIQVIVNLLDNAFKFSPASSVVEVKLRRDAKTALLSIADQGIGIPGNEAEKVFERFYRAENARNITGTGLGLSIVKYIIEEHKGTIRLEPGIEKGTVAHVRLPVFQQT